ncbi:MAG: hypothetical protein ACOYXB_02825 [Bacteroidota bacterium]
MRTFKPSVQKFFFLVMAIIPMALFGQEKVKVLVKVVEDGKTITDTVYSYSSAEEAEKALQMMDLAGSDKFHFYTGKEEGHGSHVMYISEDGETRVLEGSKDMVWTTTKTLEEGDSLKTVRIEKKICGDHGTGMRVFVLGEDMSDEDLDILLEEEKAMEEGASDCRVKIIRKDAGENGEVKVYVLNNEGSEPGKHIEKKVIIISGDEEGVKEGLWTDKEKMDQEMKMKEKEMKMQEQKMKMDQEMKAKEQEMQQMEQEMKKKEQEMKMKEEESQKKQQAPESQDVKKEKTKKK